MLWLLRLWVIGMILMLGWAALSYVLTRNTVYPARARTALRYSLGVIVLVGLIAFVQRLAGVG